MWHQRWQVVLLIFTCSLAPYNYIVPQSAAGSSAETTPTLWLVLMALLCLLVLLLPLEGDSPAWPSYLHIAVNQKLIAAFALGMSYSIMYIASHNCVLISCSGLVTMAILKSWSFLFTLSEMDHLFFPPLSNSFLLPQSQCNLRQLLHSCTYRHSSAFNHIHISLYHNTNARKSFDSWLHNFTSHRA